VNKLVGTRFELDSLVDQPPLAAVRSRSKTCCFMKLGIVWIVIRRGVRLALLGAAWAK
jgi:hypothetical protein